MNSGQCSVFGEPYQVPGDDPSWFEYRVMLLDEDGDIVDEWNSLDETYNGAISRRLTEEGALAAIEEIRTAVKAGCAADWFSVQAQ